jgi:hypothetical protein
MGVEREGQSQTIRWAQSDRYFAYAQFPPFSSPLFISSRVVQTPCKLVYKIAFEGIVCDLGTVPRAGVVPA